MSSAWENSGMNDRGTDFSPQRSARLAGFLYLIVIVGGVFAEIFVRQRLIVWKDAAATANNILAHEQLFRWGFVAELVPCLCNMGLAVIFWELFRIVNRRVAMLVVFCTIAGSSVEAVALLYHFQPLIFLKTGGTQMQLQALMSLKLQSTGFAVALTFFGIYCIAIGSLIWSSGFLPKILGVLLAIEGVCYLLNSFTDFVAPEFASRVFSVLLVSGLAEVVFCLWMLIFGVNAAKWRERAILAGP